MNLDKLRSKFYLCLVLALVAGCAGERPPRANIQISASSQLNPNGSGRASPIVIRIFGLRSADSFNNARFFELYDNGESTLGIDLVNRYEFEIFPGETRELDELTLDMGSNYLGFLAAYQDLDNAVWRATSSVFIGETVNIDVQLNRLAISVADQ